MRFTRALLAAVAMSLVVLALAACGGSGGLDPSKAVEEANKSFKDLGVTMTCPDSVSKEESFTCTLTGKDGTAVEVDMKVAEQDGESAIDTVDQGKFEEALKKAAGVG